MVLWITDRKCSKEESSRGNFFFADYGIHVHMTADTSIGWQPKQAHGTSLMEKGYEFEQVGLSIGISKRLGTIWEKYQSGLHENGNMVDKVCREFEDPEEENISMEVEEGEIAK
ncbi:hypothetical protein BGX38DRAFT_1192310 [Terfezia claveryi]|nr:hypothetical protein BGX38DRAFT_1192310 [Terfezia claveryi]